MALVALLRKASCVKLGLGWQSQPALSSHDMLFSTSNSFASSTHDADKGISGGTADLYVGNLPFALGDEEVKQLFTAFGSVTLFRLFRENPGRNRGHAFIQMPEASAALALQELNGRKVSGRAIKVQTWTRERPVKADAGVVEFR